MLAVKKTIKRAGFIYAIKDHENIIKIGKTINKSIRLKTFQTAHAYDLELLYWLAVDDIVKAERSAHNLLDPWRVRRKHGKKGEWFRLDRQGMELLHTIFGVSVIPETTYKQLKNLGLRKE